MLSDASIVSLLNLHPHFAHRCANSSPSLFFGPNKERLWDVVRREYREPALAASARQRVRELSSYHWETLKLMFVGQRNPGPDPGCVFAQLDNDALRIMAGAVADALLSTESQAVRDYDSIRALARPTSATH